MAMSESPNRRSVHADHARSAPWREDKDAVVDPHHYLLGRERAMPEDGQVLGRGHGDSELLFPKYTTAEVVATGQVTVNGKTLNLWTFNQLETLSQRVLRERANAIKDAVGEANCPAMPSSQPQDIVRWIIHMQSQMTQQEPTLGRGGTIGVVTAVPRSFRKEQKDRPLMHAREYSPSERRGPFDPRTGQEYIAARDHFGELWEEGDACSPKAENYGIVSNRRNGEGRRHLQPESHMLASGVSTAGQMREGRRYLGCDDHMMSQRKELEAWERDPEAARIACSPTARGSARVSEVPVKHASESHLNPNGTVWVEDDGRVGGDRRKHASVQDRMVNHGVSDPGDDETRLRGRRYMDGFRGSQYNHANEENSYRASWKKDGFGLRGSSMIC